MSLEQFDSQQKILWHYDRVYKLFNNEIVYPVTIEIDPSNACNEDCIWCCWKKYRENNKVMDWSLMEKIVCNLARVGVKGLIWTGGGEPLVNQNTTKGMRLAKNLGIENGMFTNGILMVPEIIPTIIECCEWIRISLGAATPETFKKCHGTDDFQKIIENIREFVRVRKESGRNITIGLSMMVHPDNYHELYEEAKIAKELGVDYFQGKPLNQMGSENEDWWYQKVIPLFNKAKEELEDSTFKILTTQYTLDKYGEKGASFLSGVNPNLEIPDEEKNKCYVHHFITSILANGEVSFCKNLRDRKEFLLGNLNEQTIEEIWSSEKRKNIIEKIEREGCQTFCQSGYVNQILKKIKSPNKKKHPNFL